MNPERLHALAVLSMDPDPEIKEKIINLLVQSRTRRMDCIFK
jgi:hypothetical protein